MAALPSKDPRSIEARPEGRGQVGRLGKSRSTARAGSWEQGKERNNERAREPKSRAE